MLVDCEQVVDLNQLMIKVFLCEPTRGVWTLSCLVNAHRLAQVGLGGDKTLANEVGEDSLLQSPSSLRPAVDGLLDAHHRVGAGWVRQIYYILTPKGSPAHIGYPRLKVRETSPM